MKSLDISIDVILPAGLGPGVYSASNRKEYQIFLGVKGGQLATVNLTAICELIVYKTLEPRRLTTQPYRPPQPVTGIALLYGDGVCFL
jgi:hypothetical protein